MTRLIQLTYTAQHYQLKKEWSSEGGGAFIMLSPTEQWALHSYYEFTEQLSDAELLAHRIIISRAQPSLSQPAGKAFSRLRRFSAHFPLYIKGRRHAPKRKKGAPTQLTILSQVHPEVDIAKLTDALIQLAREQADQRSRP
jgi:hypothetical protein